MSEHYKAVFLPIDERILALYKGFVHNGKMFPNLKREDVFIESTYYEVEEKTSRLRYIFQSVLLIPFLPLLILMTIIAVVFKKFDSFSENSSQVINNIFNLFREKIKKKRHTKLEQYNDFVFEDAFKFLNQCRKNMVKVFIYSYEPLDEIGNKKVKTLIEDGLINSCVIISNLSELHDIFLKESISLHNSIVVIKEIPQADEAKVL